jgi:hypothetical protein
VIVRVSSEGQYDLSDDLHRQLNDLDDAVVDAVSAGDEAAFADRFQALLAFVRDNGTPLAGDDLSVSQVLIPPADTTLAEAAADFSGEGLIPDPA